MVAETEPDRNNLDPGPELRLIILNFHWEYRMRNFCIHSYLEMEISGNIEHFEKVSKNKNISNA